MLFIDVLHLGIKLLGKRSWDLVGLSISIWIECMSRGSVFGLNA